MSLTHYYRFRSLKTWIGAFIGECRPDPRAVLWSDGQNPLYGVRCRVLLTGRTIRNHLIETDDGRLVVVTRWAVRRLA